MLAVSVPGTTSNLAHGFDCLGAAVDLRNTTTASVIDAPTCHGHPGLVGLAEQVRAEAQAAWGVTLPALALSVEGDVPMARGLGSSATIYLAVAAIYQRLADRAEDIDELLRLTIPLEGHPDNLVAAAKGGLAVAAPFGEDWRYRALTLPATWRAVLVVPDHEVRTAEARATLPDQVVRSDAIRAWQHTAWLVAALAAGDVAALRGTFAESWHEGYRQAVNPRLAGVRHAADAAGAIGTFLSGSGSTIFALAENESQSAGIAAAIQANAGLGPNDQVLGVSFSAIGLRFETCQEF
jgi:homoserine kinase